MEKTMKAELKLMSRKELEKLRAEVEKALAKVTEREMKAARDAAEKAAAAHGFSLSEITGNPAPKAKRGPKAKTAPKGPTKASPPKYRNPADATQTWTGKGRQPDWFKAGLAAGKSPDSMAI